LRRLRFASGRAPRDTVESSAYLRYVAGRKSRSSTALKMPWGAFVCTNIGVVRSQFEEIFVKRQYAFRTSSAAPTIVDCGGNVGISAIWFKLNYPGCRLTVYEADSEIAGILKGNLARAGYADVDVLNHAVWIEDGDIAFAPTGIDTGKIDPHGSRNVKAVDLASNLPDRVDLLKMDIEGAEFDVIERLQSSGAINKIRNLAVEFHPSRATFPRLLDIFKKLDTAGFTVTFESFLGPYCGLESTAAAFETVGRNRMFIQAYIWQA